MKRALLAGAVIAVSIFPTANAIAIDTGHAGPIVVYGSGPSQDCYVAVVNGRADRESVALCDLALNHDFLTREDRAGTFINRGTLHLRRGQDDRALRDFDSAVSLIPSQAEAHLMRGIALVQLERYPEAIETLTAALAMNPESAARAHYYRGAAQEEIGNTPAAYADYQRAADLAPAWASPRTELARFVVR